MPCFIIAEGGVNHNGDPALAHRLVDVAADAGADAIKFQTFDPDLLAAADAPKAEYQKRQTAADESQRDMLRRLVLSEAAHVELKRHAEERGLLFLSTPFEERSADFLERLGVPAFKIASGELTNHPFLRHLARKQRPLLLSTGMSELDEVREAVAAMRTEGARELALFHCTSSYPAPADAVNLRAIETLRREFLVEVGYSDHTIGSDVPVAAVALGATLLEKHITLDRTLPGPDHVASMEPHAFASMVRSVRVSGQALGAGVKRVQPCELDAQRVARKSLFVSRPVARGQQLTAADVDARRPGTGISPARSSLVMGRSATRDLTAGQMLGEGDFE